MIKKHFPGHQQALVKNNVCIAILSFEEHDVEFFLEKFKEYDYDLFVDLCLLQKEATISSIWKNTYFDIKPYESWIVNENLEWQALIEKPGDSFNWNEKDQKWEASTEYLYPILSGTPKLD
jgi:hypothetical protein